MPRKIIGPKREEVTRERKRLHNEEYNALNFSSIIFGDQMKKKEIGPACSTYGEGRGEVQTGF